jgi:protein SCO1/2/putative membrane protein
MSRLLITVLIGAAILAAPSGAYAQQSDPLHTTLGHVPPFRLTDQQGRTVTRDDLRGKVWVASFFFSTCTECNKHTIRQLQKLQREFAGYPDIRLVSFTVYPERDSPEQLAYFAEQLEIDPDRWLLLTGSREELHDLIFHGFHEIMARDPEPFWFAGKAVGLHATPFGQGPLLTATQLSPEPPLRPAPKEGAEMIHSFRFMLVDSHGKIRGYVDLKEDGEVDRLAARAKELVLAKYFPTVNASLNGLAGLLIVAGYVTVRRRWITLHKVCMVAALGVSALFLACYLYYHLLIQHGQPTLFTGEGPARYVYLAILGSHTVLAVIVTPLALVSAYLGWRNRLTRHVTIARWTLPLWLYVSVTGVVVYVMLYHLYPPG